jgi:hypothetical protein
VFLRESVKWFFRGNLRLLKASGPVTPDAPSVLTTPRHIDPTARGDSLYGAYSPLTGKAILAPKTSTTWASDVYMLVLA